MQKKIFVVEDDLDILIDELLAKITHLLALQASCLEDDTPPTFNHYVISQGMYL